MSLQSKFNLLKFSLSFLIVLCGAGSALAQQCNLKIEQLTDAPELRGFRLGMSVEQVTARVPQVKFGHTDKIGVNKTSINPLYDSRFDQASFADVRTVSLDFLDGKLTTLWIGFESSFKWQTVAEFVTGISKSLNLPASWSPKKGGQELRCDGFSVFVSLIAGSPSVRLADDAAEETIAARREEAVAASESMVMGDKSTKVYYLANCDAGETVSAINRVTFKDKDEAEKAGYKLAKACQ